MNARRNIIAGIFALILSLAGGLSFVLIQARGVSQDAQDLMAQKQNNVANILEQSNLEDFKKFSLQRQTEFEKFNTLFIDSQNPTNFLVFLETLAKSEHIELKVTPGEVKKIRNDFWPSLTLQLVSKGLSANVHSFIRRLEFAPYALELQQVTFQSAKDISAPDIIQFNVSLKVYTK